MARCQCRYVATWLHGYVATWLCCFWLHGYVAFGYMAMWLCGYAAMWLCGYVAMWLCGYVGVWLLRDYAKLCAHQPVGGRLSMFNFHLVLAFLALESISPVLPNACSVLTLWVGNYSDRTGLGNYCD